VDRQRQEERNADGAPRLDRQAPRLRGGRIHSSSSNDPRESLGQFLVRDGLISEEQLFKALSRQESEGRLLGSVLIADNIISEEQLRATLKTKAQESIYDLFLWTEGQFEFQEGSLPFDVLVSVELSVTEIVFEGIRRVDDWTRIRSIFPSDLVVFRVTGPPGDSLDSVERQALELVAAGKSMAAIALELRRSEYETAVLLFDLKARDLIAVDHTLDAPTAADPIGAVRELLTLAYTRLQERRYDAAQRAYEDVLALDRLNQNAKKGLIVVIEARDRDRATREVPLDKVPSWRRICRS